MEDKMNYTETLNQIGGILNLQLMVGAYNFAKDKNSISFRFKGSRKMNYLKITLNSLDEYELEFGQVGRKSYKSVKKLDGVYCDQLIEIFEDTTGLYLTLNSYMKF